MFPMARAEELTLQEIYQRNLEASGGREKLSGIQNFSFETGSTRSVVSASGNLKIITGKEPVITEIILVKGNEVRKNSLSGLSEVGDPQKSVFQTLGKFYAGIFSLLRFENELEYEGMKSYGLEKYHQLSTAKPGPVRVDFFLRPDDFRVKRLVFHGLTPEGDKYELSYDYPTFEEIEGLKVPLTWFVSQVGARGELIEVSAIKINRPLPEDFFDSLEVNIGKVEVSPGLLRGNVLDVSSSRFGLTITTNFTQEDIKKAGLETGDRLSFAMSGTEYELAFYLSARELPPMSQLAGGAKVMTGAPRSATYVIQFFGVAKSEMTQHLEPLMPIEIRKK